MTDAAPLKQTLERVHEAFERRPSTALSQNAVVAVWDGQLGTRIAPPEQAPQAPFVTAMNPAWGGTGDAPEPGWYFRAAIASCLATNIAMQAARQGITLSHLEVTAHTKYDARSFFDPSLEVDGGPYQVSMSVKVKATNADDARLRQLVADSDASSPLSGVVRRATDMHLSVND